MKKKKIFIICLNYSTVLQPYLRIMARDFVSEAKDTVPYPCPPRLEIRYRIPLNACSRSLSIPAVCSFSGSKFKMASEILRVDNQETLEVLQREADELKKKLEEEKAKLKDVESKVAFRKNADSSNQNYFRFCRGRMRKRKCFRILRYFGMSEFNFFVFIISIIKYNSNLRIF